MTLLVISPDYASHLFPLATLATAWRDARERVVVASGPATADIVASFGFERVNLQLGRGSNPGVIRAEDQPTGEDDALRGFFDATRIGMIETLSFQAQARSADLLWNPVETARAVQRIVREVDPQQIIVDHLAFSARLGLVSGRHRHADVVLGHPSALPVAGEVYGFPPRWPTAFHPDRRQMEELRTLCETVRDSFTEQWNAALAQLDPRAEPSTDAFAETGDLLFLNYPAELHDGSRTALLPPHAFIGSAVREEAPDAEVQTWLAESQTPVVYVSFGSFLSVRGDVLARVAEALRGLEVRAAIATGSSDPAELGEIPRDWLVRGFLPQVTLLGHSALAVSHGGNNSVTESMTAGVPMLLLPFSTDQFAGAAAVEDAGFGIALDPNTVTADELADAAGRLLALAEAGRDALDRLGTSLTGYPGARRAFDALALSTAGERLQP
ncbi:nucleotide disphospho-sugar-binding domain-containing protein [Lacisediminihabitans profunda]|uniref:Glycosyltransferase family 1 protein n=1 Tax=Lacisediminihabitans profunda TaxID=2594790 RepID=A0A5C8UR98_9MICO|nr:glycosyltransferase [Lacisediminihabitans profunda]TXN30719.1 glycosyltransferase family 1 protein [Lacisediminihabitans profunda]